MHTVCELNSFRKAAKSAGMTEPEIDVLIKHLAENPLSGDEIKGTGGCRKYRVRLETNNKGKSGGARTITFFSGDHLPLFLITVFSKNQKVSLTQKERAQLKKLTDGIVKEYETRVLPLASGDKR